MLTKNTDRMREQIAWHVEADALIAGQYWCNGKGCALGCLSHKGSGIEAREAIAAQYGIPQPVSALVDCLFERLPAAERPAFFRAIGDAVQDGRDLTRVHWAFLADTLQRLPGAQQPHIATVIGGMDRMAQGREWPAELAAAAEAAAEAWAAAAARGIQARSEWAAWAAAAGAGAAGAAAEAEAGAWAAGAAAAEAAEAAAEGAAEEIARQRDTLLRLIAEVPKVEGRE
jgi:hypothetical protein